MLIGPGLYQYWFPALHQWTHIVVGPPGQSCTFLVFCTFFFSSSLDVFDGAWGRTAGYSSGLDVQQRHLSQRLHPGRDRDQDWQPISTNQRSQWALQPAQSETRFVLRTCPFTITHSSHWINIVSHLETCQIGTMFFSIRVLCSHSVLSCDQGTAVFIVIWML